MNEITKANIKKKNIRIDWRDWFVYVVLVALIAIFGILNGNFFSFSNFVTIGRQVAMVAIIAFGMTFVITAGQMDLSVGAILGLSGMFAGLILQQGGGIVLGSLTGVLTGLVFGFVNGILVSRVKIPSFLATLGTMSIARGVALTITGTMSVVIRDTGFLQFWGTFTILGIPTSVIIMLLLFVIAIVVFNHTPFGNRVKAVGGNPVAAVYSGIKVERITTYVFIITGILSSIAGMMMCSRLSTARPEVGTGYELDAIAAAVLGGTSINGGSGKMLGTLVGAFIMGIITNGLIILGIDSNIQEIVKGAIIIIAVGISAKRK